MTKVIILYHRKSDNYNPTEVIEEYLMEKRIAKMKQDDILPIAVLYFNIAVRINATKLFQENF